VIKFGVLGPLTVHRNHAPVPLAAPKLRRLLAVLLCRAGKPLSIDELVDAMWDGRPPATARKTLQIYVHRLRTALGDPGRVCHDMDGYGIVVARDELDALRFAELLDQARVAHRAARLEHADDLYRRALEQWRGEPYANVPGVSLLEDEVRRLTELHLQAREDSLALGLDLGRHSELVAELNSLTAAYPFREAARSYLMLALYRGGRKAEALQVFRDTRTLMADELGVEPNVTLQRLHAAILREDHGLADVPVAELATVATSGTSPDSSPDGVTKKSTMDSWLARPAQLPPDNATFAGRTDALRELDALLPSDDDVAGPGPLRRPASVVISAIAGTAGIGKTTLAVHWAHRVAHQFPDGQLYVDLRGFGPTSAVLNPAEGLRGFLEALGVPPRRIPSDLPAQAGLYRSLLAGRRILVLVDNARDAEQVRPLLPGAPGCLVLVTSRSPLLGLVAADGAHPLILNLPSADEARSLLAHRLGAARIAAEPEAVDEIIRACARLPLALAIVAARAATTPGLTLATLARDLQDSRSRLDTLDGGETSTDLRTVFSWSYQTLSDQAARLFRLLGLQPGHTIAIAAVASLAGISMAEVRPVLADLIQANMITASGPDQYLLHDLLRAYAAELADAVQSEQEQRAAIHRVLDHYVHTAHTAAMLLQPRRAPLELAPPVPGVTTDALLDQDSAFLWFQSRHHELVAVIDQAGRMGFQSHAWQLAWTLADFYQRQARWHDWLTTQQMGLEAAQQVDDRPAQVKAHETIARAALRIGDNEKAFDHATRAIDRCERDDQRANSLITLCEVLERQERYAEALHYIRQAYDLQSVAGDAYLQANTCNSVGWCHALVGDYQSALAWCEESLRQFHELGQAHAAAHAWDSLGYVHHHLGDQEQAIACYERAVDIYREFGDRYNEALSLDQLGDAWLAASDPPSAFKAWTVAENILEQLDSPDADTIRAKLIAGQAV
jgi:DNA-binding SARP family transcriptional activator/tetratricopeptide (TPR) repeat protein